jgi:hypothetical protein
VTRGKRFSDPGVDDRQAVKHAITSLEAARELLKTDMAAALAQIALADRLIIEVLVRHDYIERE